MLGDRPEPSLHLGAQAILEASLRDVKLIADVPDQFQLGSVVPRSSASEFLLT